jgi:branched-chain amino acid transport system ATP-binding protein
MMLDVRGVSVHYGRVQALAEVSIAVDRGEIVALVGANGAGKSTLVNVICGVIKPSAGEIHFAGRRIDRRGSVEVVRAGIVQVAEGRQLFPGLTVEENLRMGAYTVKDARRIRAGLEQVFESFPILRQRRAMLAQTLSGGEQQMLAVGRALMSEPSMVIFDEPSLGLAPLVVERILDFIRSLNVQGMPILLIEQNVALSLEISHRAYVLERGRVRLEGRSEDLLHNPHVETAYLGI